MRHSLIRLDWWLLIPVFVLLAVSATTLSSIELLYLEGQIFSIVIGVIAYLFFAQMQVDTLKRFSKPIYLVSLVLLSVVLFIGFEARGAVRWIEVFGVSVQFSEILKPLLALSFAGYLGSQENRSARSYVSTILLMAPIVLLIALQPDLGTALIYASVVIIVLFVYGYPLWWFLLSVLPLVISSPFLWALMHDYQRQRVLTFFNPMSDPQGTSYNAMKSVIAVGSGMLLGKGIQESTQSHLRFLPERQTDFIFATLSEGLGFIGALIVIIAFLVILYRIYIIFTEVTDPYAKIYAATAFCLILVHFFINIGMNIGIVPIVGVTLPFVSYGGSSIVSNFILLGLLTSLSIHTKKKQVLEIK
jgi:rod shape determining protein RodA